MSFLFNEKLLYMRYLRQKYALLGFDGQITDLPPDSLKTLLERFAGKSRRSLPSALDSEVKQKRQNLSSAFF